MEDKLIPISVQNYYKPEMTFEQVMEGDDESSTRAARDFAILNTLMAALEADKTQVEESARPLSPSEVTKGQRFGRWKIVSLGYHTGSKPHWLLRCDCGVVRAMPQAAILSGKSRSCGCDQPSN